MQMVISVRQPITGTTDIQNSGGGGRLCNMSLPTVLLSQSQDIEQCEKPDLNHAIIAHAS
jgi:hypothetical protein